MKGKISEKLREVLANPDSRAELRDRLASGKSGQVKISDKKSYKVVVGPDFSWKKSEKIANS